MKKRIIGLLLAITLVFALFTISASAISFGAIVSSANITAIQPIGGNTPNTDPASVKFELFNGNGEAFDQANFKVKSVSYLSWSADDAVNFGEFVAGEEYLVSVEISAENFDDVDHYFYDLVAKENCKINGVTATETSLKEDNKVLVVHANLKAVALHEILDFGQVAPRMTAEDEARHQTDLGDIEFGTYTMFAFDCYPLSQAQKDMGFAIEEKIYVNQGGGTLATRQSGEPFDLMVYADQLNNPFGNWSVMFSASLYQNGVYVTTLGHLYTLNLVPAVISNVSMSVAAPVVNTAPDLDLMNISVHGEGYEVTDIDWTDTEGIIMPDQAVFEAGKIYECVLQVEPMAGYAFPENKDDFSGKINGIQGVVSPNYSTSKAYVTVQFSFTTYGDADGNTKVDAADALKALQHAVKLITLEGESYTAANVNGDDKIDATDALLMLQYTVKLIDQFPVEK